MRFFIFTGILLSLLIVRLNAAPPDETDLLFAKAVNLKKEGKYAESVEAFEALKKMLYDRQDTSGEAYALAFLYQAEMAFFNLEEDGPETMQNFERGLARCRQFGHKTSLVATAGNCLGFYYAFRELNLDKAHEALQAALRLYPKDSAPNRHLIACYKRQGSVYARKGDFEQAINYYQRGIALRDSAGNPPELNNVGIRHDLALSYEFVGRYEDARALYSELVEDIKINPNREAYAMVGLAGIYLREADYINARKITLDAIRLTLRRNGNDSVDYMVANCISRLGDIALAEKDIEKGIRYYKQVLRLYASPGLYGPKHRATAKVMFSIADLYSQAGMDSLSLDMHQKHWLLSSYFHPGMYMRFPKYGARIRRCGLSAV
ncbi:MAG: tetratricopeptide repeat protein [Bacteroidia bacterium]